MQQVCKGDMKAFGELVEMYQQPLYSFIYRYIHDRDTVLDLVHDVFLKVWRYKEHYQEDGKLTAWLFTIAQNVVRNHVKKHNRTVEITDIIADDCDVAAEAEENDLVGRIKDILEEIPEVYRLPVVMRDVDELSYAEIAEVLKISEGTVKSRISRGREMIRQLMKQRWGEMHGM